MPILSSRSRVRTGTAKSRSARRDWREEELKRDRRRGIGALATEAIAQTLSELGAAFFEELGELGALFGGENVAAR